MKKGILTISILTLCLMSSKAQTSFGLKTGVNFSSLSTEAKGVKSGTTTGFYIGGFSDISMSSKWTLHPELLYSNQGGKFVEKLAKNTNKNVKNKPTEIRVKNHYILVPILVQYSITDNFKIGAGPQFGYSISSSSKSSKDKNSTKLKNHLNMGAVADLTLNTSDNFGFNLRYFRGFSDVDVAKNNVSRNSAVSLGINYKF